MNRNNIWIHVGIAVVVITLAAVLGQIRLWENSLRSDKTVSSVAEKTVLKSRSTRDVAGAEPEVLVRFKPGVSLEKIKEIAARNNDIVSDEYESVGGLVSIDDVDDANAETTASQYAAMSDVVEYAGPNNEIRLDPPSVPTSRRDSFFRESSGKPNDPQFDQQWSLNNLGQDGGKKLADIGALLAWGKTHGSDKIVVAVLDTGVDYTHVDLVSNMWTRPDSVPRRPSRSIATTSSTGRTSSIRMCARASSAA